MASLRYMCIAAAAAVLALLAGCSAMHTDRDDCPFGLYVTFKYDYNLQRADMFNAHVGEVTLYIFDEDGQFVRSQTDANTDDDQPLECPCYKMHILGLPEGRYQFIALAGQNQYAQQLLTDRAKFRRVSEPGVNVTDLEALEIVLDRQLRGQHTDGLPIHEVVHNDLPLDTLWHGIDLRGLEVSDLHATYDTISLVRDTKKINVTLREIDDPSTMDVADYQFRIIDRNTYLLYDNSLLEDHYALYTPHALWNSDDRSDSDSRSAGDPAGHHGSSPFGGEYSASRSGVGRIAHADFMTSRIIYHDDAADDAILEITHRDTGTEAVRVDLPDMLSRLANYDDLHRYSRQEFLDRGYDYNLDFFLKGGQLKYVNISISVLSWSIRIQYEDL